MAPTIPTGEPTSIVAGDTVQWYQSFNDYPSADGWVLTYRLFGPLGTTATPAVDKSITPSQSNGLFLAAFAPADTAAVVSDGSFRLVGQVTLAGATYTVYDKLLRILANPATARPADLQTHAQRSLALIEAAIEKRLPADMENYQIDGKSIGKIKMRDLMRLKAIYSHQVWRANNPEQSTPRRLVHF